MPDYLILILIGLVMGFFGGLLGIGGSVVMIPAMVIFFKGSQHLYQAAAMICNFFVATSAVIVHRKNNAFAGDTVKWLIPGGVIAVAAGVALSNIEFFAGENSANLTRLFGAVMVYVAIYNGLKLRHKGPRMRVELRESKKKNLLTVIIGSVTGVAGGLLGMGGGTISTPGQQMLLNMPLKKAIRNSAGLIAVTSVFGAVYKNMTLGTHGIEIMESIKIAAVIIPGAIVGSYCGSHSMHRLPTKVVRVAFVLLLIVASYKMLTV